MPPIGSGVAMRSARARALSVHSCHPLVEPGRSVAWIKGSIRPSSCAALATSRLLLATSRLLLATSRLLLATNRIRANRHPRRPYGGLRCGPTTFTARV
jgi:hypothetical protein